MKASGSRSVLLSSSSFSTCLVLYLFLLSSLLLHPSSFRPAQAQARESAVQLVARALEVQSHLAFSGIVHQDFATGARPFSAEAYAEFEDARHYKLVALSPERIRGVTLWADLPRIGTYWPREPLVVTGDARSTMVISPFVYQILDQQDVRENFEVRDLGTDIVTLTPVRRIGLYPKGRAVPFRHIWIDRQTGLILKEERFLPGESIPYFRSVFRRLRYPDRNPVAVRRVVFEIPEGARHLRLPGSTGNRVTAFRTAREALTATGVRIREPSYLPPGFTLKSAWVVHLLGRPMSILTYLDGVNILFVAERPTIEGFMRFLGNWFTGGLIDKVFELRAYLPLFHYEIQVGERTVTVAGDLPPAELQRIYASLGP